MKGGRPKGSGIGRRGEAGLHGEEAGPEAQVGRRERASGGRNGRSFEGTKGKTGGRQAQLSQIEAEIDRLLFRVMHIGGLQDVEDSLRRTRRLLYQASRAGIPESTRRIQSAGGSRTARGGVISTGFRASRLRNSSSLYASHSY